MEVMIEYRSNAPKSMASVYKDNTSHILGKLFSPRASELIEGEENAEGYLF